MTTVSFYVCLLTVVSWGSAAIVVALGLLIDWLDSVVLEGLGEICYYTYDGNGA